MANPSHLTVDTVLYHPAEPEGRMFPAGSPWPGDAWSDKRGGEPIGQASTAQALKDLIKAQDTIDSLSAQLDTKAHDNATLSAERDEANNKNAALEQRALAAENGRADAEAAAKGYMLERDAAREELAALKAKKSKAVDTAEPA